MEFMELLFPLSFGLLVVCGSVWAQDLNKADGVDLVIIVSQYYYKTRTKYYSAEKGVVKEYVVL